MRHDLLAALRNLRRRPLFAVLAVTVLTLGLSASTAVITYIGAFFEPFPGVDHDRFVRIFGIETEEPYTDVSFLDYEDYAEAAESFDGLAAVQPYYAASVRRESITEVAFVESVTGSFFPIAGVAMAVGRGIAADDDRLEADPVAVISHDWWQRSFGGDREVLGTTLYLNFRPFTLVGVASPEWLGTTADFRPDVWIPISHFRDRYVSWDTAARNRDLPLVRVFGRLGAGVHRDRALTELSAVATGLDEAYPGRESPRRVGIDEATWIDPRARRDEMATVRIMMVAAGGLLLLVCANVANLLLAVAAGRRRETATRAALGASPARLVRQALIENVLLAAVAGLAALILANPLSTRLGSYFARPSVWGANVARETGVDPGVIGVAFAIAVLTGLIAGALPALRSSRLDLVTTLKTDTAISAEGGRRSGRRRIGGRHLPGAHDVLISAQVALSVLLLVVAGLVLRTLGSVRDVDPGFTYDRLIASHISTSSTTLQPEERGGFFKEISERLAEEPWVRDVVVAQNALLSAQGAARLRLPDQDEPVQLAIARVIPGFFTPLEIEILSGRGFAVGDTTGAPDVAIVNESLASRFFPGEEAVGRRLWLPTGNARDAGEERSFEIVGVVGDFRARGFLTEPEPTVFFSFPQFAWSTGSALHVSTTGDAAASVPTLQRWLREYEPHLAIVNVLPYTEVVEGFLYTQRMNAELFSALAVVGLVLAAVGIFSVLSLSVSRRTREIGIRMAIGAERASIGRLMIGRALIPVGLGLVLGLAAAFAVTGLVRSLLYGVEPTDAVTPVTGTAVLLLAAVLAAYLPARRAARVEPMQALRVER
jgi:predicted permease